MHNKKSLLALGGVVALAIVGGLLYMTMSPAKAYVGKWGLKNKTEGTDSSLELTKDKLTLSGTFTEEGKSATLKVSAKIKEVEFKDNIYTFDSSDHDVSITGDALNDEMKKSIVDSTKENIKKDSKIKFKISDDKKELTQLDKDGKEETVYKKL
jgi:hypothetical protein